MAFVLVIFAATPAANSAKELMAPNADKVDGIQASKAPKPGRLVPLGKDARFAASALPKTVKGPAGATGPQGPRAR